MKRSPEKAFVMATTLLGGMVFLPFVLIVCSFNQRLGGMIAFGCAFCLLMVLLFSKQMVAGYQSIRSRLARRREIRARTKWIN